MNTTCTMKLATVSLVAFALSGCMSLAPEFERPTVNVPQSIDRATLTAENTLALRAWQEFFTDAQAQKYIQLALDNNTDLRIAAAQVAEVRGRYDIQDATLFPAINGTVAQSSSKNSENVFGNDDIQRVSSVKVGLMSYELDFFGRSRSLSDAALAHYYSSLEAERSVRLSIIAETVNAYYRYYSAATSHQLAEKTLEARLESLKLTQHRFDAGLTSQLDLSQAQAAKSQVELQAHAQQRNMIAQRAALELLVGQPITKIDLATFATSETSPAIQMLSIPNGLSSEVLLARPDVMAAEYNLRAANANIGAARAAYFPSIRLSTDVGVSSNSIDSLFESGSQTWSFVPSINIPIFNNGLDANLAIAQAQQTRLIAEYEKAVQTAFSETYRYLSSQTLFEQEVTSNQELVNAQAKRLELTQAKYDNGISSYLEVLLAQQDLLNAQQALLNAKRDTIINTVSLYKALGGADQPKS